MRLLISDIMRRHRWGTGLMTLWVAGMWWLAAFVHAQEPGTSFAGRTLGQSMGWAYVLGPMRVVFFPRALWHLPISRRDIGRARWVFAVAIATGLTTAAKLIAMLFPTVRATFSLNDVLLSTVYDFAWTGVGCALVSVSSARIESRSQWRPLRVMLKGLSDFAWPLGMMAPMVLSGMSGPFAIPVMVPAHWSDLTSPATALLAAALAVTVAAYFHTPGPPQFVRQLAPGRVDPRPVSRQVAPGLSGLPRLLLHEAAWTVTIGGGMVLAAMVVIEVAAGVFESRDAMRAFWRSEFLLIGSGEADAYGFAGITLIVWYAVFMTTLLARFPDMLRHLRVLPLGAKGMNTLLVLWPALVWLAAWAAMIVLHYAATGSGMSTWRLPLLAGMVGLSALVASLTLRVTGMLRVFYFTIPAGLVPLLPVFPKPSPAAQTLFGLGAFVAAVMINHVALSRVSTYRSRPTVQAPSYPA